VLRIEQSVFSWKSTSRRGPVVVVVVVFSTDACARFVSLESGDLSLLALLVCLWRLLLAFSCQMEDRRGRKEGIEQVWPKT